MADPDTERKQTSIGRRHWWTLSAPFSQNQKVAIAISSGISFQLLCVSVDLGYVITFVGYVPMLILLATTWMSRGRAKLFPFLAFSLTSVIVESLVLLRAIVILGAGEVQRILLPFEVAGAILTVFLLLVAFRGRQEPKLNTKNHAPKS